MRVTYEKTAAPFRNGRRQTGLGVIADAVFLGAKIVKTANLYHQPYPPIRLDKGLRVRQYHRPNLLL